MGKLRLPFEDAGIWGQASFKSANLTPSLGWALGASVSVASSALCGSAQACSEAPGGAPTAALGQLHSDNPVEPEPPNLCTGSCSSPFNTYLSISGSCHMHLSRDTV